MAMHTGMHTFNDSLKEITGKSDRTPWDMSPHFSGSFQIVLSRYLLPLKYIIYRTNLCRHSSERTNGLQERDQLQARGRITSTLYG